MTTTLEIFFAGLVVLGSLLGIRIRIARLWTRELQVFQLLLPAGLTADDVARWLSMLAASTSIPQWTIRPPFVLGLEVRASSRDGIRHYLLVPKYAEVPLLQTVRAGLSGVRLEPASDYRSTTLRPRFARELMLTSSHRPLAVERAEVVASAFLGSLQPLKTDQEFRAMWFVAGARTPKVPIVRTTRDNRSVTSWLDGAPGSSAETIRAQHAKGKEPQLLVSIRIGAAAKTVDQAKALVTRTTKTLGGMNAPGVRLTIRWWVPARLIIRRMTRHALPLTSWLLLNARELSGLIGLPIGEVFTPGLPLGASRQLPPTPTAPRSGGVVLARSTYPGSDQLLRIRTEDRLRGMWLLGPTGVGKSTLIANMALQDAAAGHGVVLVDPKSDLCDEVLSRLPLARHDDVIVLDPAAFTKEQPIVGLNVLGQARTEHERELATDQIVYVMRSIWADSWGPRTSDVLRNAILTLTCTRAADGSDFTLTEVAPLLEDAGFRRFVTGQASVPASVRSFWAAYNTYSDAQRLQIIGPSLNKLRALSTRTTLQLTLGQSVGLDMDDVLNQGKILLVPLSKGIVGTETAQLLGSLIVAQVVNAIFARASMPAAQRRPAFVYLDEFQEVMRLATDIPDALAQARGLGVGFVLANQYIHQLPDAAKRAVFGTVRSAIVFGLQDYDDAHALERRFAPLTASDLMRLPAYEVALHLCENNATGRPVTGVTLPLPEAEANGTDLVQRSAARYGSPRSAIEAAIHARSTPNRPTEQAAHPRSFGRRKRGSDQ